MQLSPPFFTVRIKSLHGSRRTASAKDLADSLSKPLPRCRSCFISDFFGWRAAGIKDRQVEGSFIPFSLASASALAQSHSSCSSRKADRSLPSPPFWPAVLRSWPSPGFCFFTNRLRGSGSLASAWPLSDCFCCANNRAELVCRGREIYFWRERLFNS